jgi:hypothetical protein
VVFSGHGDFLIDRLKKSGTIASLCLNNIDANSQMPPVSCGIIRRIVGRTIGAGEHHASQSFQFLRCGQFPGNAVLNEGFGYDVHEDACFGRAVSRLKRNTGFNV